MRRTFPSWTAPEVRFCRDGVEQSMGCSEPSSASSAQRSEKKGRVGGYPGNSHNAERARGIERDDARLPAPHLCAHAHCPRADSNYNTTLLWRDVSTNIVRRKGHRWVITASVRQRTDIAQFDAQSVLQSVEAGGPGSHRRRQPLAQSATRMNVRLPA
jgi:hypothetical protein